MKKLSFLALFLSTLAFGTSIRPVALESVDTPLFSTRVDSEAKIIRVALDGEVFGGTCNMRVAFGRPGPDGLSPARPPYVIDYSTCEWDTVTFLSRHDMRRITRQIDAARVGEIRYPQPGDLHCLAIPTRAISVTADNGTVLLKSGSYPCGSNTYNKSVAAQKLIEQLQSLRAEYEKLSE